MIITAHTSLKCKNRSRCTPVQRKHSLEKRRCYQSLKSHTLWKCNNRSRPTPVQRKRSHDITQVQHIITTHTSLKCHRRSRPTLVQRKRSPEKRRCYQALKHVPYGNAIIALDRHLCSEHARMTSHKCTNPNQGQPRLRVNLQ